MFKTGSSSHVLPQICAQGSATLIESVVDGQSSGTM